MKLKRLIPTMILATMTIATSITAYAKPMPSNAIPTTAKIQYNNEPVKTANGFVVDGYTYVRGRDLADICYFTFVWDKNMPQAPLWIYDIYGIGTGLTQQEFDEKIGGTYNYNNENYVQVRNLANWGLSSHFNNVDIGYNNQSKVITIADESKSERYQTRYKTQGEYMKDNYTNTTTSDVQQDTSTSNVINNTSDSNASTNDNTTTPNKDTSAISNKITEQDIQDYNEELLRLVNEARVEAGVKPLTLNQELIKIATAKADEMVELDYFSHTSPTYGEPRQFLVAIGGEKYSNKGGAENITKSGTQTKENYYSRDYTRPYGAGCAYTDFLSWWNSQGHKDNMLNPKYTEMGASIGKKDSGNRVGVQMFIY